MRVRVALPITKPLCRGGYIVGTDGERTWVKFKYERLPMFCHCCGLLGHDLRHCASHFAEEKKGGDVEYQYEDWLKALGSHPRALQKHDKDRTYGSHGDTVDEQQPEMVDSAAIIVLTAENQRESITDEIGNDEIHGSILMVQEIAFENLKKKMAQSREVLLLFLRTMWITLIQK
uniref:Zinc knuckle CX2CX4HX4C domain-containing protein n=1 Tax=Quercus lobata TaxID=97700 RepID=A0A7N2LZ86_QUELO